MNSESPNDSLPALRSKAESRTASGSEGEARGDDFELRYVEVPRRRRAQLAAERNLKWGLALLLLALGLIGAAVIISGPRAVLPLIICLTTFTILWVVARLRIFHQRNGVFFATALICLLGAAIPMIENGYLRLDELVNGSGASHRDLAPSRVADGDLVPVDPEPEPALTPLVDAFKVRTPADAPLGLVRILADTTVTVGRKPYLLRAGDTFALEDIKDGSAIFLANEMRLSLPDKSVELLPPKRNASSTALPAPVAPPTEPGASAVKPPSVSDGQSPAEITARAKAEAIRRYPGIGQKDATENLLFVQRVRELKAERPEFFDEPAWPVYLAEALAQEMGWQRAQ